MIPSTLRPKQHQNIDNDSNQSLSPENLPPSLKLKSQKKQNDEFLAEGENDLEREIERNTARGTSRILETIGGLPGDLYSFAKGIFGADKETYLPTSEKLQKFSEEASLGYTKAQNEAEEKSDEVIKDIASFMLPGAGKYNLVRNIGIPVVANLAKEGLRYTGAEKTADAAKIGTMIVLDLMHLKGGGAKKFASSLFEESEKLIPEGTKLTSLKFDKSLSRLEKSLESGGSAPSKDKALKKIYEIRSKIKDGEVEVRELIDFRKSINEIKSELGGYEVQLPKHIKKKAIANLDLVKKEVINGLNEYGSSHNPQFLKLNKAANEAYAAYESSDKMGRFLNKTLKDIVKNPGVKTILGLSGAGYGIVKYGASAAKLSGIGAPALYAGYQTYKVLHQVIQSPTLRKFYGNILKGAASGNASQVSKNAKALDKALQDESTIE